MRGSAEARRAARRERIARQCMARARKRRHEVLDQRRRREDVCVAVRAAVAEEMGVLCSQSTEEPLSEEDCMLLEQEVLALLLADESQLRELEAEERRQVLEVEHYAAQAIPSPVADSVACPLCLQRPIFLRACVFHCECGFRLDAKNECISIEQFRQRLAMCFETHSRGNEKCTNKPKFSLVDRFGVRLLVSECGVCNFMQVVL